MNKGLDGDGNVTTDADQTFELLHYRVKRQDPSIREVDFAFKNEWQMRVIFIQMYKKYIIQSCILFVSPMIVHADDVWSDCRLRIVFDGESIPKLEQIPNRVDKQACGDLIANERLLIDEKSKGISNVVLYIYTGRHGRPLNRKHSSHNQHKTFDLSVKDCRISPRIACIAAGDDVIVRYGDARVAHNLNFPFLVNAPSGATRPLGVDGRMSVKSSEPVPIPIKCNIHAWMKGYLVVLDHRYVGVSDHHGVISIKNLPVGETLAFRIFHESIRFARLPVGNNSVSERNVITATIHDGMNDLGEIRIPLAAIDLDDPGR